MNILGGFCFFFCFFCFSNLGNAVIKISKSGYKYYTSYRLLKLLLKTSCCLGGVLCDIHCGSPESHYCGEQL